MTVVSPGGEERGVGAGALGDLEPEHAVVERQGAIEGRDFEVDVPDPDGGIDGGEGHGRAREIVVRRGGGPEPARNGAHGGAEFGSKCGGWRES